MEPKILDDHAAFNRFQVMEGWRVDESGTSPSVYITEVKLKKLFSRLGEEELKSLFSKTQPLSELAISRHREKVCKKLSQLPDEKILTALNLFLRHEDIELCARYVLACSLNKRKTD